MQFSGLTTRCSMGLPDIRLPECRASSASAMCSTQLICSRRIESKGADVALQRRAVNPVAVSVELGLNQGVVSGHSRTLYCSGQTAISGDGKPQHDGDIAAKLALSLDNLEAVLGVAGMSLASLVRLKRLHHRCRSTVPALRCAGVGAPPGSRRRPRCSA
jgi:enamine deaminase RidA (YjgF/YER057c/UK114 family)